MNDHGHRGDWNSDPRGASRRIPALPTILLSACLAVGAGAAEPPDVRPPARPGRFAAGVGAGVRSLPYRGADSVQVRVIPSITYIGERLRILGPFVQASLITVEPYTLEATGRYHFGVYEEDDSPALRGLGDREDTFLAGLSLTRPIGRAVRLRIGYEHDLLDRIGGGIAEATLQRNFAIGPVRVTPALGIGWLSPEMSNDRYGVPGRRSTDERPAYRLGDTIQPKARLGAQYAPSPDWQITMSLAVERLDDEAADSPIVKDDFVVSAFGTMSYAF